MRFELQSLRSAAPAAVLVGFLAGLAGCPGTLDDPGDFHFGTQDNTLACAAEVPTTILQPTCGVTGCHSASAPAEGLDLSSPGVAARLVNVPGTEMPSSGLLLIDSADPSKSVLLTKLQAATLPYGSEMPLGGNALSAQEIACVAAWVDSVVSPADAAASD